MFFFYIIIYRWWTTVIDNMTLCTLRYIMGDQISTWQVLQGAKLTSIFDWHYHSWLRKLHDLSNYDVPSLFQFTWGVEIQDSLT